MPKKVRRRCLVVREVVFTHHAIVRIRERVEPAYRARFGASPIAPWITAGLREAGESLRFVWRRKKAVFLVDFDRFRWVVSVTDVNGRPLPFGQVVLKTVMLSERADVVAFADERARLSLLANLPARS